MVEYSKMTNRIFIGNSDAAKNREFLKSNNIKAVLNCTTDVPNYSRNDAGIEYMRIPVEDSLKEKDYKLMFKYLPVAVEFIHKHADIENHNILIHCWAGQQRSAVTVLAYLITKKGKTLEAATKCMMVKRPEVFHCGKTINFDVSLKKYLKERKK